MAALALSHRPRLVAAGLVLGLLVALALVGPGQTRSASGQEPATPVCPAGSTFNAATGQCETPGIRPALPSGHHPCRHHLHDDGDVYPCHSRPGDSSSA